MTIDKAADKMKCLKYKALQGAIIVHDTYSDDYELFNESALTALDMAIASLEAWGKVRQEMEDYKYIPVRDLLITLNRHLQEVTE